MAKLLVKDPKTGNIRPMTQKSYDAAGQKRGFKIVGKEAETGEKSEIQQHMDRLRAEKAAKQADDESKGTWNIAPIIKEMGEGIPEKTDPERQRQKPGPKPKPVTA